MIFSETAGCQEIRITNFIWRFWGQGLKFNIHTCMHAYIHVASGMKGCAYTKRAADSGLGMKKKEEEAIIEAGFQFSPQASAHGMLDCFGEYGGPTATA
ncbi:hypothetical protein ACJX0J_023845, partial [Zea mays]